MSFLLSHFPDPKLCYIVAFRRGPEACTCKAFELKLSHVIEMLIPKVGSAWRILHDVAEEVARIEEVIRLKREPVIRLEEFSHLFNGHMRYVEL